MNSSHASASCNPEPAATGYRGQQRPTPPRSESTGSLRIPYRFNPVPHALHAPAHQRPDLRPTDKTLEQTLCAMMCKEGRPDDGLAVQIADLVNWSGLSPSTVSRSIGRLEKAGALVTSRIWLSSKPNQPRRWIYKFQLPSMTSSEPLPTPAAEPITRPTGMSEKAPHVSLTCQEDMHLVRSDLKKEPLPPTNGYEPPARADARGDGSSAIASGDDAPSPSGNAVTVTEAEPGAGAPQLEAAAPRLCSVFDWEPEADFPDQADTHDAVDLSPATFEEHIAAREVEEVPPPAAPPPDPAPAVGSSVVSSEERTDERTVDRQADPTDTQPATVDLSPATLEQQLPAREVVAVPDGPVPAQAEAVATSCADHRPTPTADHRRLQQKVAFPAAFEQRQRTEPIKEPLDQAERAQIAERLRSRGLWDHGVRRILSLRTPEEIGEGFSELAAQTDVMDPAAWLYAHLVKHWDAIQEAKADEDAAPLPGPGPMSEAEAVRLKEQRRALLVSTLSFAEREAKRWADLEAKREREAEQERTEREASTQQTARETAAALAALSADERAALRERARASFGGKAMPEGVIVGAMVGLLETDQRRALAGTSRGG